MRIPFEMPSAPPPAREVVLGVVSRWAHYPAQTLRMGGPSDGSFSVILEGDPKFYHGRSHSSLSDVYFMKPGDRVRFECENADIVDRTFVNESFRGTSSQD